MVFYLVSSGFFKKYIFFYQTFFIARFIIYIQTKLGLTKEKHTSLAITYIFLNKNITAGGLKSDRNGFTKMRVTALIIVRLL